VRDRGVDRPLTVLFSLPQNYNDFSC
jgi:hypothetical protein